MAIFAVLLLSPVIALFGSLFRALVLFWPVMVLSGALHAHYPAAPALGWEASFFLVAVLSLIIPISTTSTATSTTTTREH